MKFCESGYGTITQVMSSSCATSTEELATSGAHSRRELLYAPVDRVRHVDMAVVIHSDAAGKIWLPGRQGSTPPEVKLPVALAEGPPFGHVLPRRVVDDDARPAGIQHICATIGTNVEGDRVIEPVG